MTLPDPLPPGRYRHFKGAQYSVLGVARHSETLEEFVIYRQEYGDHGLWVRPKQMFLETVTVAGQNQPRFRQLQLEDANDPERTTNLLQDVDQILPTELVRVILTAANVRVERIVSQGHGSPDGFWYDQDQHEWVVVLTGAARLRFEDGPPVDLGPGNYINIPAHKRHRVEWTTPDENTIWLAVHYK